MNNSVNKKELKKEFDALRHTGARGNSDIPASADVAGVIGLYDFALATDYLVLKDAIRSEYVSNLRLLSLWLELNDGETDVFVELVSVPAPLMLRLARTSKLVTSLTKRTVDRLSFSTSSNSIYGVSTDSAKALYDILTDPYRFQNAIASKSVRDNPHLISTSLSKDLISFDEMNIASNFSMNNLLSGTCPYSFHVDDSRAEYLGGCLWAGIVTRLQVEILDKAKTYPVKL